MPDFEWKVDEEAAWEQPERLPAPLPSPRRPNRWLWGGVAVVLLVTALLFYIRLNRQVAQTDSNLTEEVTAAFRLLWHADRQRDLDLFAQLRHDTGRNAWRTEIDRAFASGLLFERAVLGFSLANGEPEVVAVTFSPDWQTAVLTAQIAYDTAFDFDPVHLIYPLFYEQIEGQWLMMSIQTDSTPVEEPKNPDTCTLYALLKLFMPPQRLAEIHDLYVNGGAAYGHIKQELFELIRDYFSEARGRKKQLLANQDYLREVLARGADKARKKAVVTLDLVRDRVGLKY